LTYEFNHVHLKAADPKAAADWYVKAFGFTIVSDSTRNFGDRFIACDTIDGTRINISNERTGETLGNGDAGAHFGIEHFGVNVENLPSAITELTDLGAELLEGPIDCGGGLHIAFIKCPQDTRVELLQLP
jgi:catechol 2,3-dioxygenase-like lactoylglutathione lyase family enzyme|tara:strand:- start:16214 stop:16603 length:390 start_codon:yes stop_codon:yes gene_type:complete